ncbi:MAG: hypothetical protein JKX98_06555 [Alcanivoracaceae bacterium]|nr:hypothetical protein [Alcanivoracaceae bacterium]
MSKYLDKIFSQDNKRINNSVQPKLSGKINRTIKNISLVKGLILIIMALIGAGVFSWSLGLVLVLK